MDWLNSTGDESSAKISTIIPSKSDSISLNIFIASIIHKTCPFDTLSPTFTNTGSPGFDEV